MAVLRTPAIILRHQPDREHDRTLTVLTPDHGQLRLRARGTKKSASKLGGSLEPLTEVDLLLANGKVLDVVIGSIIRQRFADLRRDPVGFMSAQWLLELIERITKPNQADPELYSLVLTAIHDLEQQASASLGRRWLALDRWAWRCIAHQGFTPDANRCATCSKPLEDETVMYHPSHGFHHVYEAHPDGFSLHRTSIVYLVGQGDPANERQTLRDIHRLLEAVIHHTIDRPLASQRVLQSFLRLEQRLSRASAGLSVVPNPDTL